MKRSIESVEQNQSKRTKYDDYVKNINEIKEKNNQKVVTCIKEKIDENIEKGNDYGTFILNDIANKCLENNTTYNPDYIQKELEEIYGCYIDIIETWCSKCNFKLQVLYYDFFEKA